MSCEIERKFLLADDSWRASGPERVRMVQGYLAGGANSPTVRVRIAGEEAFLTIKGKAAADGISRSEFEYPIPLGDAENMLRTLCGTRIVEKIRYYCGRWEIDEYLGLNAGLFTAEIELETPDEAFERPAWLGREVSFESAYSNGALSRHPYSTWEKEAQ